MAEEEKRGKGEAEASGRKRVTRLVGAAALALILLALGWTVSRLALRQEPPASVAAPDIGTVDMVRVLAAHPDYARLKELRAARDRLRLEIEQGLAPLAVKPPETDAKPFEDAVWQKNAQAVSGRAPSWSASARALSRNTARHTRRSTRAAGRRLTPNTSTRS